MGSRGQRTCVGNVWGYTPRAPNTLVLTQKCAHMEATCLAPPLLCTNLGKLQVSFFLSFFLFAEYFIELCAPVPVARPRLACFFDVAWLSKTPRTQHTPERHCTAPAKEAGVAACIVLPFLFLLLFCAGDPVAVGCTSTRGMLHEAQARHTTALWGWGRWRVLRSQLGVAAKR